jgi:pyruvate dehydrogenase E1 component
VRLLGSGALLREVIAAAELLAGDWQVQAEVWSATSYSELAREAERWNSLHPQPRRSHVETCLAGADPVVLASDYVRAWPQPMAGQVRQVPFKVLGTDGFGRSDTRAALHGFFEVDRQHIVLAALTALREQGRVDAQTCMATISRYGLAADAAAPRTD